MRRRALMALLALGLAAGGTGARPLAAQEPDADAAWNRGDLDLAERLYRERLLPDSTDQRALHRLALLLAWSERYAEGVQLFDRLLVVAPDNGEARRDRAKVLSWAGRFDESIEEYGRVAVDPRYGRAGRLGLAQVLSWSDRLDSAVTVYRAMLDADPDDLDARRGLARVTAWTGDLVTAEAHWREALAQDPDDPGTRVGLSQTLRWQGRAGEAYELVAPLQSDSTPEDVQRELDELRPAIGPQVAPTVVFETDSDDNDIATVAASGGWRPLPRLRVELDGYLRRATRRGVPGSGRQSGGVLIGARGYVASGWTVSGGVGLAESNSPTAGTALRARLDAATPARHRIGGTVSYRRGPLDATAQLIDRGVRMDDWGLSVRAEPAPRWSLAAGYLHTRFSGSEPNHRNLWRLSAVRRLSGAWALGVRARAFTFSKDLTDGYFDPDFYGVARVAVRWQRNRARWSVASEVAPGVQQVGSAGSLRGVVDVSGRVAYRAAPGREIGLSAVFSSSGLQNLTTGGADYRYLAITVFGSTVF